MRLVGVDGAEPFYSKGEIYKVFQDHLGELASCYGIAQDPSLVATVDLQVILDAHGGIMMTNCDVRQHPGTDADAMCTCMTARASTWRFPAPHGQLGLLKNGAPVAELKVSP